MSAARRILILQGHPDPVGGRLCHALADAYAEGAAGAGHTVQRVGVADLDFPLLRSKADFETGAVPDVLAEAQAGIAWAEHIVIVFPLWLGEPPALLKGFLEQVLRPGFAFDYGKGGFPKKRLAGRSAHVVVTMGMPSLLYRWVYGSHAIWVLQRSILGFVGIRLTRRTLFGSVEAATPERRQRWLTRMREAGRRAA